MISRPPMGDPGSRGCCAACCARRTAWTRASHEEWPVARLASVSGVSEAALRALVQRGLRCSAASLSAHAPHRASHGAAPRHRPADHRHRVPDRLEQPRHLRAHLPRHYRREPERASRARASRGAPRSISVPALLRQRRPPPRPQHRSFGEAATRERGALVNAAHQTKRRSHDPGCRRVGLYVRDQDEALDFYVGKLGFKVHTDARNGDYRSPSGGRRHDR